MVTTELHDEQRGTDRLLRILVLTTAVVAAVMLVTGAAGVGSASAQSFQEDVNETFGGSGEGDSDNALAVVQTQDGGYALGGETESFGPGDEAAWLVKTDENGNEEFNVTFGGSDFDTARAMIQTQDGGFALAGSTQSFGPGGDAWLIKTDKNGTEEFNVTFGGLDGDEALSVFQTDDDGYVLSGFTQSFDGSDRDAWLIKTDENGTEEFNVTFGKAETDEARSVVQTQGGGFAIGGDTESFSPSSAKAWLIKTDENGTEEFNETFGTSDIDSAQSIVQTPDDGFALGGFTESFSAGGLDAWLIKTDENGTEEFNETYGGGAGESGRSVVGTDDGGFALGGSTESFSSGGEDGWLVKTDSNGNEEFNRTFGAAEDEEWRSLVQTTDGGFAFGGDTRSFEPGNPDSEVAWLLKISPEEEGGGAEECIDRRDLSRGQEDQECPTDRELGRGEDRRDLDRGTGRRSDTSRRDRGRSR